MSGELSIGELARRMNVATSAIRFYESQGLVAPSGRRSGRRRFEEEACDRIALIRLAQSAGFSIAEIRTLLHGFPSGTRAVDRWRSFVEEKRRQIDERAAELRRMRALLDTLAECGCPDLDACGAAVRQQSELPG